MMPEDDTSEARAIENTDPASYRGGGIMGRRLKRHVKRMRELSESVGERNERIHGESLGLLERLVSELEFATNDSEAGCKAPPEIIEHRRALLSEARAALRRVDRGQDV